MQRRAYGRSLDRVAPPYHQGSSPARRYCVDEDGGAVLGPGHRQRGELRHAGIVAIGEPAGMRRPRPRSMSAGASLPSVMEWGTFHPNVRNPGRCVLSRDRTDMRRQWTRQTSSKCSLGSPFRSVGPAGRTRRSGCFGAVIAQAGEQPVALTR